MAYKIVWLKRSVRKPEEITHYLENNWSKKVGLDILDIINYKVFMISGNPQIGMRSAKKRNVRKLLITKQIYLFYTASNNLVKILTLFDTRQNPNKLKL